MSCSAMEAAYSETVLTCKLDRDLLKDRVSLLEKLRLLNRRLPGLPVILGKPPGQHLCAILLLRDFMVHPEPGSDIEPGKHMNVINLIKKIHSSLIESRFFQGEDTVKRYYTHECSN